MPSRIRRDFLRAAGAGALAAAGPARAQEAYPSRALKLVVPFPPGALTDLLGRAVAERLGRGLGQTVVVENRPGAGTLVGAEQVAKSPPDGYTLLISTSSTFGISPALYKPAPIDPLRDFQPVSLMGTVNFFLVASTSFPARNFREMVDLVRANPGKYNYASVGNGSAHQLFMEDLKRRLNLDVQHVPYKGTPAAFQDLIPGKVQIMFADATIAVPNIQAGKVQVYGTSAAKQNSMIAAVPPVAQFVPGFDWQAWQGVSVPAATPAPIVARLSAEMQKFQQTAEFRELLGKFGMEPWPPITPAEFAALVKAELPRWAEAVRVSGAKVD
ncbi:MAG: tripartite tricarboxylate transporter substrate binding protein [Burkholderiales bacterium]|nr:tripartite tricarboxylate transporter substrate binding protein [Burkholderiales bacterium]